MRKIRTLVALSFLGLAASRGALAQSDLRAPWVGEFWGYAGASAGESRYRTDCADTDAFACDRRDTGFKLYAGGRLNDVLALEAGYTDLGRIDTLGGNTKAWAAPISLVAGAPLGERFRVFGKLGGLYGRTDVTAAPSTLAGSGRKSGWGWTYGAGSTFAIANNVELRADWDRYRLEFPGSGTRNVDLLSAGLQLRF